LGHWNAAYPLTLKGNYPEALEHFNAGLKIVEDPASEENIWRPQSFTADAVPHHARLNLLANIIHDVGSLYGATGDNAMNKAYYFKAIDIAESINEQTTLSIAYMNLGSLYLQANSTDSALILEKKALNYADACGFDFYRGFILSIIGNVYMQQEKMDSAIYYFRLSLQTNQEQNVLSAIGDNYASMCMYFMRTDKADSALVYARKARDIYEKVEPMGMGYTYHLLSTAHESMGNTDSALFYLKLLTQFTDSIYRTDRENLTLYKNIGFNEQLKLQELEKELAANRERIRTYALLSGIAVCMLIAFLLFRNSRNRKKANVLLQTQKEEVEIQKSLVEEKQRDILGSIAYALRIQTAILPPQKIVRQHLSNSFILYKPKDIVAGDFYWMEIVDDLVLFAACDCTGHGVPGAMVSVVCHNALNRAVREFGLREPAAILDKTTEIVIESFNQSEENISDGMDISICAYKPHLKNLQWAGANNPLWLIRNGDLLETKADKQPIGRNENSKPFSNHSFTLTEGDSVYLFTDGFADQFGGDRQKKLTRKRFKELLLSVQSDPMKEQGTKLDQFITAYRKDLEQVDDILVMGVRV
ncbi:MAG TPA: SpoIIE family protein phosphatase, partial [Bacteroidia bacterium]|nr:SpoIIE family protein phosphatase [Bacteroidia bacterium]